MSQTARRRPVREAASDEMGGRLVSVPMVTPTTDTGQSPSMAALESALVGVFWQGTERSRRRTFFTLKAAERAIRRARARGDEAHLVVCELVPVREVAVETETRP